jgi:hypothetical protein
MKTHHLKSKQERAYTKRLIIAISLAAERVGGIHRLEMPCEKSSWFDCVVHGHLFYNYRLKDGKSSTGCIKL